MVELLPVEHVVSERRAGEEKRSAAAESCKLEWRDGSTRLSEENEHAARASLEKASKVYGGHMGAGLEEHGIWGTPDRVIEAIERHRALGCSGFVIEFFGRDTRVPAQLFAETVLPHYRD